MGLRRLYLAVRHQMPQVVLPTMRCPGGAESMVDLDPLHMLKALAKRLLLLLCEFISVNTIVLWLARVSDAAAETFLFA